jgi:hypothetical protein
MDKELREAQSLTKDDLVGKLEAGRPAKLARRPALRDPNQRGSATVGAVIARTEREEPETRFLERGPMIRLTKVRVPVAPRTPKAART